MKTILVTGGAGFIGSNFIRYIWNKYPTYRVIVLDVLTYAANVNNLSEFEGSERFHFWYGNIRNGAMVDALVAQADIVIHFAAETHVTRSIYDNTLFFETDVLGTQVVANSVLRHKNRVKLFVHVSTSEVYGNALTPTITEEHPLNPTSPYAAAKCGADRLIYSYFCAYNIPAVIVRPFNNYGAYQHLEKMIPRFITNCILKEPLVIHGDGLASRDWLHVMDHCRALDTIIHADRNKVMRQIFNVGSTISVSILDIAKLITDLMNVANPKYVFSGDRPGQVFRHTCNFDKIKTILNWEPQIELVDGLKETIMWYKNNIQWWQPQLWMRKIPIISADGSRELH